MDPLLEEDVNIIKKIDIIFFYIEILDFNKKIKDFKIKNYIFIF